MSNSQENNRIYKCQLEFGKFRDVANTFLQAVDARDSFTREQFLEKLEACLPALYSAVLRLFAEDLEHVHEDEVSEEEEAYTEKEKKIWREHSAIHDRVYFPLYRSLREKFGTVDVYWNVWDSTKREAAFEGVLADDIADIYVDLKRDLWLAEAGLPLNEVVWDTCLSFQSHWGQHLTAALKAIYDLRTNKRFSK